MNNKWIVSDVPSVEKIDEISKEANVSRIVSAILAVRGYNAEKAKSFIEKDDSVIYDPMLINGMGAAVDRINKAIESKEKITVFGDYDADGVTATSLLICALRELNADVDYYIPDRETEGYGISVSSINTISQSKTNLIITVDCGITAVEECEYAKTLNIDLIITDHHECGEKLPDAVAVLDLKRNDSNYPFDSLAGVGMALKLAQALLSEKYSLKEVLDKFSELAMIGSVADIVPITDENRVICDLGLKKIKNTENVGIKALIDVSGIDKESIDVSRVGYIIAPKINAVGRLENASKAVELFLSDNYEEAYKRACEMNDYNLKRQNIELEIFNNAEKILKTSYQNDKILVLSNKEWHHGVVGIVSSRIVKKYNKPCILISKGIDGLYKGSGRSVCGFSIYDALEYAKEELVSFGGHELAVGLTLEKTKIDAFRKKINEYADKYLTEESTKSTIVADLELRGRHLNMKTAQDLQVLQPFGTGNFQPVFYIKDMTVQKVFQIGPEKKHLKLELLKDGVTIGAVAFGFGENNKITFNDVISVMACLEVNEYRGVRTPQLRIIDIK